MKKLIGFTMLLALITLFLGCPNNPPASPLKLNTKLTTLAETQNAGASMVTRGTRYNPTEYGDITAFTVTDLTIRAYDYIGSSFTAPVETTFSAIVPNGGHLSVADLEFPEDLLSNTDRLDLDLLEVELRGAGIAVSGGTMTNGGAMTFGVVALQIGGQEIINAGNTTLLFVRPDWCSNPMVIRLVHIYDLSNNLVAGKVVDPMLYTNPTYSTNDTVNEVTDSKYDFLKAYWAGRYTLDQPKVAVVIPLSNLYRIAWKDSSINDTTVATDGFEIGTTSVVTLTNPNIVIQFDLNVDLFDLVLLPTVKYKSRIDQNGNETPLGIVAEIANNGEPVIPTPLPTATPEPTPEPTPTTAP